MPTRYLLCHLITVTFAAMISLLLFRSVGFRELFTGAHSDLWMDVFCLMLAPSCLPSSVLVFPERPLRFKFGHEKKNTISFSNGDQTMKNVISSTILLGFAFACDDSDNIDIQPLSGLWYFDEGAIFDDSCVYEDKPTNGSGLFAVKNNGDSTFTIDTADGTDPFLCSLSGRKFTCPERAQSDIPIAELNSTLKVHVSASGELSSSSKASGYQKATISCEGTMCKPAADFLNIALPCSYSIRFSSTYQHR